MNTRCLSLSVLALAPFFVHAGASVSCDAAPPAAGAPDAAKADELRKMMSELLLKSRTEPAAAMEAFAKMLPDKEQLRLALADGTDEATLKMIMDMHAKMREQASKSPSALAKEANTQTNVWGSTTEDLAKYEKGSVAFNEFPGGARKLASAGILRPGQTFYEVEFVEPGHEDGMKYHLFYHDGKSWRMLGALWRLKLPQLRGEG